MKETKHEINERKIRNGKRKQFEKIYGTKKQIMDKLTNDHSKKASWPNSAYGTFGITRGIIMAHTPSSGKSIFQAQYAMQQFGRACRDSMPVRAKPYVIDFESNI